MCGIAGIHAWHLKTQVDRQELERISAHMHARGPDGNGSWHADNGRCSLAHRRLAIIDPDPRSAQPMVSADGNLAISFNGEIYNYRELRRDLEREGCRFSTESDTEVLLQLYARHGQAMLSRLRGMFAFAVYDQQCQRLFLARDTYGIKPLYYSTTDGALRFASQLRALEAGGNLSKEVDEAGLAGFCLLGSVPEPWTIRRAICSLPAGCFLWCDERGPQPPQPWQSLTELLSTPVPPAAERKQRIREALLDSVRAHLVADVPVGAFLSAGIDSGALLGLMRDAGQQEIRTITLAFDEFRGTEADEVPLAEEVARRYQTSHVTRYIRQQEFEQELDAFHAAMDQPTIDGLNVWLVSKVAREQGLKVAISGLGGDELFGGYPSFRQLPAWVRGLSWLPPSGGRLAHRLLRTLPINPRLAALPEYGGTLGGAWLMKRGIFAPDELPSLLGEESAKEGLDHLNPIAHVEAIAGRATHHPAITISALESSLYMRNQLLRDADWAGMAQSLEIRVPLVDAQLGATVNAQWANKRSLALSPTLPLPDRIVSRPKTTFLTPVGQWMRQAGNKGVRGHWSRRWAIEVLDRYLQA